MTNAGYASGASVALSLSQGYFAGKTQESNYEIQKYQLETDKQIADLNAKTTSMYMAEDFNKTMASNAVIAAAQGRSGGTVNAIGQAAMDEYQWDKSYVEFSNDIQQNGLDSQIYSTKEAGKLAGDTALSSGVMNGLSSGASMYSLMGGGK